MKGQGRKLATTEQVKISTWAKIIQSTPGVLVVWEPSELEALRDILATHVSYLGTLVGDNEE